MLTTEERTIIITAWDSWHDAINAFYDTGGDCYFRHEVASHHAKRIKYLIDWHTKNMELNTEGVQHGIDIIA